MGFRERTVTWQILGVLAALLAHTAVFGGAEPGDLSRDPPPLLGRVLVAAPSMPVEKYRQIVIVVTNNGPAGSMGIAINRSTGDQPWASFLTFIERPKEQMTGQVPIYSGGPMEPELVFTLHSTDYSVVGTRALGDGVATTAARGIFDDIYAHRGPKKFIIAVGYIGWAPGQLEQQLAMKMWNVAPLDAGTVFDADRDTLWEKLNTRYGKAPVYFLRPGRRTSPASLTKAERPRAS